jgi:hypothetical protein
VGFQIFVAPIDSNQITQERFLRNEASGVRNGPVHTTLAGVPALAFHGFDAAMGQTYEVWFILLMAIEPEWTSATAVDTLARQLSHRALPNGEWHR